MIVVDGGSTDGTAEAYARGEAVTVLVEPGANISRGRNVALASVAHEIVAATDADCELDPDGSRRSSTDRGGRRRVDGLA